VIQKLEQYDMALSLGSIAALIWGLGVSVRAFLLGPTAIEWAQWFTQLMVGTLVCLAGPLLVALLKDWATARLRPAPRTHP
jgi:hypothetical protein